MGQELSVWMEGHFVNWPQGSESIWEWNSPLGRAFLGISRKQGRKSNENNCPRPMQSQWLLSQREEENLSHSYSWCPQESPIVPTRSMYCSKAAGASSEVGLMLGWAEPTASTQMFFGCFLDTTWYSLLQDASFQAEYTGVPSVFLVGLAAWLGGIMFRMLEEFTVSECPVLLQRQDLRLTKHLCCILCRQISSPCALVL